jgi:hypothetical protein
MSSISTATISLSCLLTSNYLTGRMCFDIKSFDTERSLGTRKGGDDMGQMHPLTALELEAARRREILLGERSARRVWNDGAARPRAGRQDGGWLATALTAAAAGTRLARG